MSEIVLVDDNGVQKSAYGGIWLFGIVMFVLGCIFGCLLGSWATLVF